MITAAHPHTYPDGSGPSHGSTSDDPVIVATEPGESATGVPERQDVGGNYRYEWDDRPLSDDERKGAFKLVGLLVAGWLLGGLNERNVHSERKPEPETS